MTFDPATGQNGCDCDCDCGCCAGLGGETPLEVVNRPGLQAIGYRVGTHASFKASMLARLSASNEQELEALHTRSDDDFTIGLIDAWACLADVLTFYQERIANESYLRTATDRLSLLELARLIGYELRPGVAAATWLAFTMEEVPGAPPVATIDVGTRAQSVPGPGEQPQTFETIERIEARGIWNALRPRQTQPQTLSSSTSELWIQGTSANLQAGDSLLLLLLSDTPGGSSQPVYRRVARVAADPAANRTRVILQGTLSIGPIGPPVLSKAATFTFRSMSLNSVSVSQTVLNRNWTQADLAAVSGIRGWPIESVFQNVTAQIGLRPRPTGTGAFVFRARASIFGHNAIDWRLLPPDTQKAYNNPPGTDWPFVSDGTATVSLDGVYKQIVPGSWVALRRGGSTVMGQVTAMNEQGLARYAISGNCTQVTLDVNHGIDSVAELRGTAVYAQSEQLELAEVPIDEPVAGTLIALDRLVAGLKPGQLAIVSGERSDLVGVLAAEVVTIAQIDHDTGQAISRLTLAAGLQYAYRRDTVTINANVAPATHGESVSEVLGSADASQPFQSFSLRQPPLTYVSAATASGTASTLAVRVNDQLWHEVPTLYGRLKNERIFTTRRSDDGRTTVLFGDGRTGARPPTGAENVRAWYRKGTGRAGLVADGQITTLLTRPLGVKGVVNPLASTGADDPESRDSARTNAPLTVLTLDRIVSLQDYEDFARAFAGVAKAAATWTWSGQARGVYLTVAGPGGAAIGSDSPVLANLLAAILKAGDPHVPIRVSSYRPAYFRLAAGIKIDPDSASDAVLAAVEQALRLEFAFERREFGQPVALSQVVAVIQGTAGVLAVDLDRLYRFDEPAPALHALLPASAPQAGDQGTVQAAELLLLDPAPLLPNLVVMP